MTSLSITVNPHMGIDRPAVDVSINTLVIAGWTGRDEGALRAHIDELAAMGIAPPGSVPIFYRVSAELLTTASAIHVVGAESSGEAEAVLIRHDGEFLIGIGSDHTDRKLEAVGITLSKQVCAKPMGSIVWRWSDVADHWDQIVLASRIPGSEQAYQEGPAGSLRRPDELWALYEERNGHLPDGSAMFCGTLAAHGGIRFSDHMTLSLTDPVLGRSLQHGYAVDVLPIAED